MNRTKRLRGPCQHCGAPLEFPAEIIGTAAPCPHCGKNTELLLETPRHEPTIPTRVIIWTVIAVAILAVGLGGAFYALNKTKSLVRDGKAPAVESRTNSPAAR